MRLPERPPDFATLLAKLIEEPEKLSSVMHPKLTPAPEGKYRHWDGLRHRTPPPNLSHEEWWLSIKFARLPLLKPLPLLDKQQKPFYIAMPDPAWEMVQRLDRDASGKITVSEEVTNPATRDRYIISSLIDEAITSSQIEGAATTYKIAKDMIRSGRPPKDRSEQMILSNYLAMKHVSEMKHLPLTEDRILELHRLITADTLDDPTASGRLRRPDELVHVWDTRDNTVLHIPPDAIELEQRMALLCDFANERTPDYYIHPVVRAVILHFWIGYDHPFVDGNGRTARALFYWSMLRSGYWLCEYISISRIVKRAFARYMRAYLYTESDSNDITYFVLFNLRVVEQAIGALHSYLELKMKELREIESLVRRSSDLNHRQIALLSHALRHQDAVYTIDSHRNSHGVVYQTARSDLITLAKKGLLVQQRARKGFKFSPPRDLNKALRKAR